MKLGALFLASGLAAVALVGVLHFGRERSDPAPAPAATVSVSGEQDSARDRLVEPSSSSSIRDGADAASATEMTLATPNLEQVEMESDVLNPPATQEEVRALHDAFIAAKRAASTKAQALGETMPGAPENLVLLDSAGIEYTVRMVEGKDGEPVTTLVLLDRLRFPEVYEAEAKYRAAKASQRGQGAGQGALSSIAQDLERIMRTEGVGAKEALLLYKQRQ